jgi:hypothetical protein
MSSLLSKILAGGLSAGVFLLWWPRHFPVQGLEWLVLRGVLWTLSFELLHVALAPVEHRALGPTARWLGARRPRRAGWVYAGAALALVVPALLLTEVDPTPRPRPAAAQARPKVVRQVIVKRQRIVQREVVVREVPVPVAPDRVVVTKRVEVPAKRAPAPRQAAPAPEPEPEPAAPEPPATEPEPAPTGSSSGSSPRR